MVSNSAIERELSPKTEPRSKKPKLDDDANGSDPPQTNSDRLRVMLNPADCDLDFDIEQDGLQGSALHEEGFAYCWSGARANVGITGGKYCFSCKIVSAQPVIMEDTPLDQQHVCRLGISRGDDAVGNLGEALHSFGFGGTGKFSCAGNFSDYGEKFGVGDTIVCCVDLESKPLASIGFSKNGKWLGVAKEFDGGTGGLEVVGSKVKELQWKSAVFPHVLLKNVVAQLHFSVEDGLIPEEGYKPWASALDAGNAIMGPNFSDTRECEVMMMVGLPASGKSTWAEKWVHEHPEKRCVLLGTNLILDQMKVPGLLRKHNYGERFDRLMGRANAIFDTLLSRAAKTPRNYVIDQTNVFKNARKRKLRPFANFRKTAVVVFPKPEVLKSRADKRFKEMGKEVPADALNNMLANYVLPTSKDMPGSDELFDQVIFVELDREESRRYLKEMKCALPPEFTTPCPQQTSVEPYTTSLQQNQGALSVGSGPWQSSHPRPMPLNPPPSPLNYGYQNTNQGFVSSPGTYGSYQSPLSRAAVLHGPYESSFPGNNSAYSGNSSGVYSGSSSVVSGGKVDYQNYRVGEPYGRTNTYGMCTLGGAAVSEPYKSSMVTPSPVGTARTSSFTYNTMGGSLSSLQAPRAPTYLPSPSPSLYGSPYGSPWSQSQFPSSRPPYTNFPAGMPHSGGYRPPHPRDY